MTEREATQAEKQMIERYLTQQGRGLPDVAAPPTVEIAPAPIAKERRYIFRSRPGTVAKHRIRIPAAPPPRFSENEKVYDYMQERYAKKYGPDGLAHYADLVERNGGEWYIEFATVNVRLGDGKMTRECVYQTDDEDLAAFVREAIADKGTFYEDVPPVTVRVGHRDVTLSVANDAERVALLDALQGEDPPDLPRDKYGKPIRGVAKAAWLKKQAADAATERED